ncbi:MAG: hypothetical protein KDH84_23985, partial [Calditrichaeota bacterium]|nr:hypothetical protein [Calditrichota bacterium]
MQVFCEWVEGAEYDFSLLFSSRNTRKERKKAASHFRVFRGLNSYIFSWELPAFDFIFCSD